jgi:hypothetical protein
MPIEEEEEVQTRIGAEISTPIRDFLELGEPGISVGGSYTRNCQRLMKEDFFSGNPKIR